MQLTGENHIGFSRSAQGNISFRTFDPVKNLENEQEYFQATESEVKNAVRLAEQSFLPYSKSPKEQKASFLTLIAQKLELNKVALLSIYQKESGLTEKRGEAELSRTMDQLKQFAKLLLEDNWNPESFSTIYNPDGTSFELRKRLIPLGPVVVFGASNFPFAYSTIGGDTVSALAAGCPVIVKGHPLHAGTSELVAGLIIEAAKESNLPEGVFSHLHALNFEVGKQLVKHDSIKAVGFTGSIEGGRALMDMAAKRKNPIPVFAEMGSLNPVVFFEEELKHRAKDWASKFAYSVANDGGQFCTKPGLLFVPSSLSSQFEKLIKDEFDKKSPTPFLSPSIEKRFVQNKKRLTNESGDTITVHHAQPSVLSIDAFDYFENPNVIEEVFGPFSIIISYKDTKELLRMLKHLKGQLTASLIATPEELKDNNEVFELLQQKAGRLIYNGVPTGVKVVEAMQHGGPYPSSSDSRFTAVGAHAIYRFVRPVAFQNFPNPKKS